MQRRSGWRALEAGTYHGREHVEETEYEDDEVFEATDCVEGLVNNFVPTFLRKYLEHRRKRLQRKSDGREYRHNTLLTHHCYTPNEQNRKPG